MRRLIVLAFLLLFSIALPALTQSALPEYIARDLDCRVESGVIIFRFNLENVGGRAHHPATIIALRAEGGGSLATAEVQALEAGGRSPVELQFPSNVATGSLRLNASVSFNPEDAGGRAQPMQVASCRVNIPAVQPTRPPVINTPASIIPDQIVLPGDVKLDTGTVATIAIALCCAGLIVIGLFVLLIRGLTRKSGAVFPTWQPPYVPPTMLNPASQAGARAGWQENAASDALPSPCLPMDHAARKVLLGMEGIKLRNWRIDALRASQYDMYGRITRTQVIATHKLVKHLNHEMDKAQAQPGKMPRSPEAIVKALRPSATWLANRLLTSTERTPSLPIALDIRLIGDHGTVRILFELYTCADGGWQIIDAWEPEMMLRSGVIAENFSYTFYGRHPNESKRSFKRRLREEIAQRLGMMLAHPRPIPAAAAAPNEPPPPAGSTSPSAPVLFNQPSPPPTQEIPRVPDAPNGGYEF